MTVHEPLQPWTVTRDEHDVLTAWVTVLNRMHPDDSRQVAIAAMHDFSGHACVQCACAGAPMTVTAAYRHRAVQGTDGHQLALHPATLRVIP